MDAWIEVRGLRVMSTVGVRAHERRAPIPLLVDVEVLQDIAHAARTDRLATTVDYSAMADELVRWAAQGEFRLLETMAGLFAQRLLDKFPSLQAARVRVAKPSALVNAQWAAVQCEVRRGKEARSL